MSQLPPDCLDYRGLKCPLPVLKARRALKSVEMGAIVTIAADDPASPLDMAHFCQSEGHQLEQKTGEGECFIYLITKGERPD